MLVGFSGSKADTAIAHDDGCHAVPAGRRHFIVPGCLAVIVGVYINKARRHNLAGRINLFATFRFNFAHKSDTVTINCHIAHE